LEDYVRFDEVFERAYNDLDLYKEFANKIWTLNSWIFTLYHISVSGGFHFFQNQFSNVEMGINNKRTFY
jgi:hypothetical protein